MKGVWFIGALLVAYGPAVLTMIALDVIPSFEGVFIAVVSVILGIACISQRGSA